MIYRGKTFATTVTCDNLAAEPITLGDTVGKSQRDDVLAFYSAFDDVLQER